jgi:hypothetical protein
MWAACLPAQLQRGVCREVELPERCTSHGLLIGGDEPAYRPVVFKHNEHSRHWKKTVTLQTACF